MGDISVDAEAGLRSAAGLRAESRSVDARSMEAD